MNSSDLNDSPQAFSGGLDELGVAYDLLDLLLRAVAPHVVFLEYVLDGHVLVYAAYDVVEYLLLTLGEGGGSWHSTLAFYC